MSATAPTTGPATCPHGLGHATPILRVQNLDASLAYYVDTLGFKVNWHVPGYASVSRDRCTLMLCEGSQGHSGTWVWIGSDDIKPLWEEFRTKGAKLRHPPTNYYWAYEMQIFDLDGHVLRFGSDPKPDQPEGEWLDENGNVWLNSKIIAMKS
jgi:catechol 2,3-dioxygenase-like lactoylglutathione lyase family enzyme